MRTSANTVSLSLCRRIARLRVFFFFCFCFCFCFFDTCALLFASDLGADRCRHCVVVHTTLQYSLFYVVVFRFLKTCNSVCSDNANNNNDVTNANATASTGLNSSLSSSAVALVSANSTTSWSSPSAAAALLASLSNSLSVVSLAYAFALGRLLSCSRELFTCLF
jgi:hypothetical protein